MSTWPINVDKFPGLQNLNSGQRYSENSLVAHDMVNMAVLALIYLHRSGDIDLYSINAGEQFTPDDGCAYEDLNLILEAIRRAQDLSGIVDSDDIKVPAGRWSTSNKRWYSLLGVNSGENFQEGDGTTFNDWNIIIEDLLFLSEIREIFTRISALLTMRGPFDATSKQFPHVDAAAKLELVSDISANIQAILCAITALSLSGSSTYEAYIQAIRVASADISLQLDSTFDTDALALPVLLADTQIVAQSTLSAIASALRIATAELPLTATGELNLKIVALTLGSFGVILEGEGSLAIYELSMSDFINLPSEITSNGFIHLAARVLRVTALVPQLMGQSDLSPNVKQATLSNWTDIENMSWKDTTSFNKLFYHIIT